MRLRLDPFAPNGVSEARLQPVIETTATTTTSGGGGSGGTISWGPSFGVAPLSMTSTPALTKFGVQADYTVTNTPAMTKEAFTFPTQTVSSTPHGSILGCPFWQSVGKTSTNAAGATSITVTAPTGIQNGDLLLAFVGISDVIANPSPVVNLPSGWTSVIIKTNVGVGFRYEVRCMWKIAASESGNYTFNWSTGAVSYATAQVHRIGGIDPTTPIAGSASNSGVLGLGNPSDPPAPIVNTGSVANTLIFAYLYHDHLTPLSRTHTPPAGHIERVDEEANIATVFQGQDSNTQVFIAAGSQAAVTIVCTETANTDWITLRVAVAPGPLVIG